MIINGNAPINACAEEGEFCEAFGEGGTGFYGGTNPEDNSGILKYVRVEFAGTLVSPENELNGIAFQGVVPTEVDFIQVHMNADDGVEFFGGNVFAKHLIVTGVGDDSWTGSMAGKVVHSLSFCINMMTTVTMELKLTTMQKTMRLPAPIQSCQTSL